MWSWMSSDHEKNAVILEGCGKICCKETLLLLKLTQKSGMVLGLGSVPHCILSGGDIVTWINGAFKFMQVFPMIFFMPCKVKSFLLCHKSISFQQHNLLLSPKGDFPASKNPCWSSPGSFVLKLPGLTHWDPLFSSPSALKITTRQLFLFPQLLSPVSQDYK